MSTSAIGPASLLLQTIRLLRAHVATYARALFFVIAAWIPLALAAGALLLYLTWGSGDGIYGAVFGALLMLLPSILAMVTSVFFTTTHLWRSSATDESAFPGVFAAYRRAVPLGFALGFHCIFIGAASFVHPIAGFIMFAFALFPLFCYLGEPIDFVAAIQRSWAVASGHVLTVALISFVTALGYVAVPLGIFSYGPRHVLILMGMQLIWFIGWLTLSTATFAVIHRELLEQEVKRGQPQVPSA